MVLGWDRSREMVILGSQYAGEMKKGIFTVMHYLMPKQGVLSLHSGCNIGAANDVSLFFGLSGRPPAPVCKTGQSVSPTCCAYPSPSFPLFLSFR